MPIAIVTASDSGIGRSTAVEPAFLCSPGAQDVTGASWVVDGGLTLMAAVQEREAPGG